MIRLTFLTQKKAEEEAERLRLELLEAERQRLATEAEAKVCQSSLFIA